jgi:hypothetical protein
VLAFDDANGNLWRDLGEGLLANAAITVYDQTLAAVVQYVTDGVHEPKCFSLAPGTYYVQETDPPGYISTGPNWWAAGLLSQSAVTVAFADRSGQLTATSTATVSPSMTASPSATPSPTNTPTRTVTATLTPTATVTPRPTSPIFQVVDGWVWRDDNQNGLREPEELPLSGIRVLLERTTVAGFWAQTDYETATDADGYYHFADVAPGAHVLTVPPPGGLWSSTGQEITVWMATNVSVRASFGFYRPSVLEYLPLLTKGG